MDSREHNLQALFTSIDSILYNRSIDIPASKKLVVTTDTLIEDVHFPANTPAHAIGYKSLAVNLSDIAAMGATPLACSLVLGLPVYNDQWLQQFVQGWSELALKFNLPVCKLNTFTTSKKIEIHVTAFGLLSEGEGLYRHTAQTGDLVYVSGSIGEAAAGLSLELPSSKNISSRDSFNVSALTDKEQRLVSRLRYPMPRIELGLALNEVASACLDISDGLIADLGHIAQRSKLRAQISCDALYLSEALRGCSKPGLNNSDVEALDYALVGGDDYELCFTIPPVNVSKITAISKTYDIRLTCIGEILEPLSEINTHTEESDFRLDNSVKIVDIYGDSYFPKSNSYQHFD